MNTPQKWLRSTSSSQQIGNQQRQFEEDRDGGPPYGSTQIPASEGCGICAPATSKDVDDLDQLAAFLELSGLWVRESTLKNIFGYG